MDLAMPGMDGWETIRRIARGRRRMPKIAIISANAFEGGVDNDVGISPEDFITKPFRVDDLLDWIGRQLVWNGHMPKLSPTRPHRAAKAATCRHAVRSRKICGSGEKVELGLHARHT